MLHPQLLFEDRYDAGRQVGARLTEMNLDQPVVLALPRGGVPVAWEVAHALRAPLGVVLVRKIGAPSSPEFAIGAVAEVRQRHRIIDPQAAPYYAAHASYIDQEVERLFQEIERRRSRYAGPDGKLAPPVEGRTAIVVDDGIATGNTMRAALEAVADEKPERLIFAAPIGAAGTVDMLRAYGEAVVLGTPLDFRAVSIYYRTFAQTDDEEVVALLERARNELPRHEND